MTLSQCGSDLDGDEKNALEISLTIFKYILRLFLKVV